MLSLKEAQKELVQLENGQTYKLMQVGDFNIQLRRIPGGFLIEYFDGSSNISAVTFMGIKELYN